MTRPMPSLMHLFTALLSSVMVLSVCPRLGPNFQQPAELWRKEWRSPAIKQASRLQLTPDFRQWWLVFNDPLLERLIAESEAHNSSLRIAGLRVMEARAQLALHTANAIRSCNRPALTPCTRIGINTWGAAPRTATSGNTAPFSMSAGSWISGAVSVVPSSPPMPWDCLSSSHSIPAW